MRVRWLTFLLLVVSAFLSPAAAQGTEQADSAPPAASASSDYRLGSDDRVRLIVFGVDTMSREYPVGPNGSLSLPLIGDVPARGRTVAEITENIRARLADGFVKDPNVSLVIVSFRPFNILGEVNKPGAYAFRDGMTLAGAVALAEGYTYRAQRKYVFIQRAGSDDEKRVQATPALKINAGDTIRVGERYF
jgi:protein involved in polysaccharide export with SLBB domain